MLGASSAVRKENNNHPKGHKNKNKMKSHFLKQGILVSTLMIISALTIFTFSSRVIKRKWIIINQL